MKHLSITEDHTRNVQSLEARDPDLFPIYLQNRTNFTDFWGTCQCKLPVRVLVSNVNAKLHGRKFRDWNQTDEVRMSPWKRK